MSSSQRTEYDAVPYPSLVYPQTHPDRLATIASLLGLQPAPVDRARVLELGCGDGTNLITMAFSMPEASFCGIDLAEDAIARGVELIRRLGLRNVELRRMNLLDAPGDLKTFDYIVAHGIYSWVPPGPRDKILAVCAACLAPHGIAYVSYNAHPGNHLRDLVRHMMRFHAAQFPESADKVRQARALIKFAAEAKPKPELWQNILSRQLERITEYADAGFYHDDLSPTNDAVYFHEFAEHAARHSLEYLAEADLADMLSEGFTDATLQKLNQLNPENVIVREQYVDFLKGRSFRQTLLCRQGLIKDRSLDTGRVPAMAIAAEVTPANGAPDLTSESVEDFNGPHKAVIGTGNPVIKAALVHLGSVFPQAVPFEELLGIARVKCGRESDPAADSRALADFFTRCYAMAFVELHVRPARFVTRVSERPVASPLARIQLERGELVSTLRHRTLKIQDSFGRQLLRLCDGSRDHAALAGGLVEALGNGTATFEHEGRPLTDPQEAAPIIAAKLPDSLLGLARSAVFVG
jgi:methyltransferase-like protein/ubiquinone/menaquinone biosynthesis C-methylase UbiE